MMKYKIATIGGDGIGPEVLEEAFLLLDALKVPIERKDFSLGAKHYLKTGEVLNDETLEELKNYDAIFLGAVGPPIGSTDVPPGLLERNLLLKLRFEFDLYINKRPYYGVKGSIANGADFVVIRENTEGPYVGEGGFLKKGTAHEVATQGSVNTRHGVERALNFAFELAETRNKKLTLVHKTNVLSFAGNLWERCFRELSESYPEVQIDYCHVDAACIYLVERAQKFDVIVTDNLFGDILTDLAGAVTGGIGLAASANLNPEKVFPSMFEPVHGAAHDIVGQGIANPLAAILSAGLMLDHLGMSELANKIQKACHEFADSVLSANSNISTKEITKEIIERTRDANN